jgi:hypothetical protein
MSATNRSQASLTTYSNQNPWTMRPGILFELLRLARYSRTDRVNTASRTGIEATRASASVNATIVPNIGYPKALVTMSAVISVSTLFRPPGVDAASPDLLRETAIEDKP